jgi:hypothetical protein
MVSNVRRFTDVGDGIVFSPEWLFCLIGRQPRSLRPAERSLPFADRKKRGVEACGNCLTGKSKNPVQPSLEKYSAFPAW